MRVICLWSTGEIVVGCPVCYHQWPWWDSNPRPIDQEPHTYILSHVFFSGINCIPFYILKGGLWATMTGSDHYFGFFGLWVCSSAWCEKDITRKLCKNPLKVCEEIKERPKNPRTSRNPWNSLCALFLVSQTPKYTPETRLAMEEVFRENCRSFYVVKGVRSLLTDL